MLLISDSSEYRNEDWADYTTIETSSGTQAAPLSLSVPSTMTFVVTQAVAAVGFWYHYSMALEQELSREACSPGVDGARSQGGRGAAAGRSRRDNRSGNASGASAGGGKEKLAFYKITEEEYEIDWYSVLKLPQAEAATEAQIRSAYKRRCLETHPDKQKERSDVEFKKVQRAFEILGNADARRSYDSSRPFDDSIPLDNINFDNRDEHSQDGDELFYATYAPVFERNKRFSSNAAIPSLGDNDTTIEQVHAFYDQWMRFKTWRDFSHLVDMEDTEGMIREEKRWYQRDMQKQLDRHRKEELKRIRTLVEQAMKHDPRLRREREGKEAEKRRAREEKEARREALIAEAERKRQQRLEEERAAEAARREAARLERERFDGAFIKLQDWLEDKGLLDDKETNLLLAAKVRVPNITFIKEHTQGSEEAERLVARVMACGSDVSTTAPDKEGREVPAVPAVVEFNAIVQEKERALGRDRYGQSLKAPKTAEQLAAEAKEKEAARKEAARRTASGAVWTDEDLSTLNKAIARYPGGTIDRWTKMAHMLKHKFTEDDVLAKTKELEAALRKGSHASTVAAQLANSASSVTPSASAATAASGVEDWSPEQQRQLEAGLRSLQGYKEKDKFQKIAANVSGKTAKQCFERFKYLCSLNKK